MVANARQYGFGPRDIVSIEVGCPCCGQASTLAVDYNTWKEFENSLDADKCFGYLPIEQRVLFTGGLCPQCIKF